MDPRRAGKTSLSTNPPCMQLPFSHFLLAADYSLISGGIMFHPHPQKSDLTHLYLLRQLKQQVMTLKQSTPNKIHIP